MKRAEKRALLLALGSLICSACWGDAATGVPLALRPLEVSADLPRQTHVPAVPGALADHSLLLVTLDTTRADRLGCYGNAAIETPTLDGLATGGVVFSDCTAVAPTTLPSHASLLTGLYPAQHGTRANGLFRLEEEHETLAERLRAAGFRTGAVVSAFPLTSRFGLAQGFDVFVDDLSDVEEPLARHFKERRAGETTALALQWLAANADERFFLWVHYFDPHHDYAPPEPFAERYEKNLYDGELAYVDAALATLLAGLEDRGWADRTLVAVVGDHGEGLGQHSEMTHAFQVYDSTLRVPLILNAGGRLGGGVHCTRPVSQVDVAPLLLSLLGAPPLAGRDGADLLAPFEEERPLFFETLAGALEYGWEPLLGVRLGRHKYTHSSQPELFDVEADPAELVNLVEREPATAARLRALLPAVFGDDLGSLPSATLHPGLAELEELQELGYLGGGGAGAGGEPVPPQRMVPVLQRVFFAEDEAKPAKERIAELEDVLREHPDFYPAWRALGNVHRAEGHLDEAVRVLERCLELAPGSPQTTYELALVRSSQKQMGAEVLRLLEPVVAQYPDFLRARYLYGTVLGRKGRLDEAIVHLKAVFEVDPDYERCIEHLISAYRIQKRGDEIRQYLEEFLAGRPGSTAVRLALAELSDREGDIERAEGLLREGLATFPDDAILVRQLALLLSSHPDKERRDPDAAIALLEDWIEGRAEPPTRILVTLGALYHDTGRHEKARRVGDRALERAEAEGGDNPEVARRLIKRLDSEK